MKENTSIKYMELRNKLEYYRKKKGLTQDAVVAQLSKHGIDVDRSSISHWESGVKPDFETLCALSDIYGVSLEDFKPGQIVDLPENKPANEKPKSFEDLIKDFKAQTEKSDADLIVNGMNKHGVSYLSGSGICDVYLDDLNLVVGKGHELDIHYIPIIISELKKLGYYVAYGEMGGSLWNTYFQVIAGKTLADQKRFENDLSNILFNCLRSDRIPEDDVIKRARQASSDYIQAIDSLTQELTVGERYSGEFHFITDDGRDNIDALGFDSLDDVIDLLPKIGPEEFFLDGVPGAINKDSIDTFIASLKTGLPCFHIYWISDKGDQCEEDFAHDEDEFAEILKTKKREYFMFLADEAIVAKRKDVKATENKVYSIEDWLASISKNSKTEP